ncbi:MAG: deoxynucleoside kinase [Chloroflexi bacterium]|nr:deoxynucleoside kinase [Chloroflexota bacterium]
MIVTRAKLIDLARREAETRAASGDVVSAYLVGSVAYGEPLLGGTADVDLVLIHAKAPDVDREMVPLSADIHLDIVHHARERYAQPRGLRVDPWIGPAISGPVFLYDPQHFFEWAQAGARGQFFRADHAVARARSMLQSARTHLPHPLPPQLEADTLLETTLDGANAAASLAGAPAAGRRLLLDLERRAQTLGRPEVSDGLVRLLGIDRCDGREVPSWLGAWARAFDAASPLTTDPRRGPQASRPGTGELPGRHGNLDRRLGCPQRGLNDGRGGLMKTFVAVAGNIGVGKSTLVQLLCSRLAWEPFYEPVGENPYLADFYTDMRAWSFHSQVFFLTRRLRAHRQLIDHPTSAIQDRSVYEDAEIFARNLFLQGQMADRDYQCYWELYQVLTEFLPPPDLVIYLRATTDTLRHRIELRGRGYEQQIQTEYLEQLNSLYQAWIDNFTLCPVLTVPSDDLDYVAHTSHLDLIVTKMREKLEGKEEVVFDPEEVARVNGRDPGSG